MDEGQVIMRVRPFREDDIDVVASIMASSFDSKWSSVSVPREVLPRLLLERGLVPLRPFDGYLVAEDDSGTIGFVTLRWRGKRRPGGSWQGRRTTPLMDRLRLYVRGIPLEGPLRDGEAYIDTIVVSEPSRGRGVGTALLDAAEGIARELGAARTSLHVATDNEGTVSLYRGLGLVETSVTKSALTAWLLGHREWSRMSLPLDPR